MAAGWRVIFIRRLIGTITIFAGLLAASSAWACSCYRPEPDEFARHVAILFEGRLERIETVSPTNPFSAPETGTMVPPDSLEGVFSVQHVYKGDLNAEVHIRYWGNHG